MPLLNPNKLNIAAPAKRIISLVPSLTETLAYLGLEEETVGITKFCVHPHSFFESKPRVGGTKNIQLEKLLALQPDLVIASKEENVQEQVEAIAVCCPVLLTDIVTIQDAFDAILSIGTNTQKVQEAEKLVADIQYQFSKLLVSHTKKAAYFIWKRPWMVAGGDTYIHQMMRMAGYDNLFEKQTRYPTTTFEEISDLHAEVILLSSEPYPFKQADVAELQAIFPHIQILLVDGEMFSWYGSRLLHAAPYFRSLHQTNH